MRVRCCRRTRARISIGFRRITRVRKRWPFFFWYVRAYTFIFYFYSFTRKIIIVFPSLKEDYSLLTPVQPMSNDPFVTLSYTDYAAIISILTIVN